MKTTILTIMGWALLSTLMSQTVKNQGSVTYEEVMKFNIQLDNMTPEMQELLPKENRSHTILYFDENASRYENLKESEDAIMDHESEGGMMKVVISQPENIVFRDLKKNVITEQKEFMSRTFLVEQMIPKDEWRLTGAQKEILDYPCQEAVKFGGDSLVRVWFTPAIQVSSGPAEYANLPGLVLAVEANKGDRTITATAVNLDVIEPKMLQKPKKGKKVSQEEFLSIVNEKNKEMGTEGGGKTMIMTIQR